MPLDSLALAIRLPRSYLTGTIEGGWLDEKSID
jgi:hypothetical protein